MPFGELLANQCTHTRNTYPSTGRTPLTGDLAMINCSQTIYPPKKNSPICIRPRVSLTFLFWTRATVTANYRISRWVCLTLGRFILFAGFGRQESFREWSFASSRLKEAGMCCTHTRATRTNAYLCTIARSHALDVGGVPVRFRRRLRSVCPLWF